MHYHRTHEMVKLSQGHLSTDILTHSDECNAKDSESLKRVIFLASLFRLIDVIVAVVQHSLDLEHVARSCERADLHKDLRLLRDRVLDGLQRF